MNNFNSVHYLLLQRLGITPLSARPGFFTPKQSSTPSVTSLTTQFQADILLYLASSGAEWQLVDKQQDEDITAGRLAVDLNGNGLTTANKRLLWQKLQSILAKD